jgi:hypothetical protein
MAGAPNLFFAFSGGGNPILKSKPRWWEAPTFMKIEQDEALMDKLAQDQAEAYEKIMQFAGVLDEEE